jgi:hypothetical protein
VTLDKLVDHNGSHAGVDVGLGVHVHGRGPISLRKCRSHREKKGAVWHYFWFEWHRIFKKKVLKFQSQEE